MYNGVLGLLSTYIIGYIVSVIINIVENNPQDSLDPHLFIPPVAKRLHRQQAQFLTMKKVRYFELLILTRI